jgi:hypothetical protein
MNTLRTSLVEATTIAFAVSILSLSSASVAAAEGPCLQWDFPGATTVTQSNGWTTDLGNVARPDLPGWEATSTAKNGRGQLVTMRGPAQGRIQNSTVNFSIFWNNGSVGRYSGSVDPTGLATGFTYDEPHPESNGTWRILQPLTCVQRA